MAPNVSELVQSCTTVASLPSIYSRLSEVMHDPYSSAADFGAIIVDDPGLTTRLLQLVNSAFYGLPTKMDSVTQALAVIGTNQLHDLALATSVVSIFAKIPQEIVDMESFWRHSLACGVIARAIAAQRREPNVERLFVAGMLHDIGRLVLFLGYPEGALKAIETARDENRLLYEVEQEQFNYEHGTVGRKLLSTWGLPLALQEPIGFHHDPKKSQRFPIETAIIHVADVVAHGLLLGNSGERFVPPLSNAAMFRLSDDFALTPGLIQDIRRQYDLAVQAILKPTN